MRNEKADQIRRGKYRQFGEPLTATEQRELNRAREEVKAREIVGEEVLARRFERGLDLWTGKPLRGRDQELWFAAFMDIVPGEGEGDSSPLPLEDCG